MKTKGNTEIEAFNLPGDRLNHLLDQIGFMHGRGRVISLQHYLARTSPELLANIKYTTVRSWLQDHAPPMRKIDVIIQSLQSEYEFRHDISLIKTWWKVGGFYPFINELGEPRPTMPEIQQNVKDYTDKLQFVVMALVTEVTGEDFKTLSGRELLTLKNKAVKFYQDFSDPFTTECPAEYLRIAIKDELSVIVESKKEETVHLKE